LAAIAEPLTHPYDAELGLDFVIGTASPDDDLFKSVLELALREISARPVLGNARDFWVTILVTQHVNPQTQPT
jgi:hypothetical protein